MKKLSGLATVIILLSCPVFAETRSGKYVCVTDYAVGIMPQSLGRDQQAEGPIVSGRLALDPEAQKFFLTIKKNDCFIGPPSATLQQKIDKVLGSSNLEWWELQECIAEYIATVGKYGSMISMDGSDFESRALSGPLLSADALSSHATLSLFGSEFDSGSKLRGGEFHLYERVYYYIADNVYIGDKVYRGRCEFVG
jgi:hypothetical protein